MATGLSLRKIFQALGLTQIHSSLDTPYIVQGAGASAPVAAVSPLGGDPKGAYFTMARTGVGLYNCTTKFSAQKCVSFSAQWLMAALSSTKLVQCGVPVKNATGTWTFPLQCTVSGAATDITAGDYLSLYFVFSDSQVLP